MKIYALRVLLFAVGNAIPYWLYWLSGSDFVRSVPLSITALIGVIFGLMAASAPID